MIVNSRTLLIRTRPLVLETIGSTGKHPWNAFTKKLAYSRSLIAVTKHCAVSVLSKSDYGNINYMKVNNADDVAEL